MDVRVSGCETLCDSQGRDCLLVFLAADKRNSPTEIRFGKIGVELRCLREPGGRLVPVLVTPRKFSQYVLSGAIVWVELEFLQKFLLRAGRHVRPRIRSRKQ